MKKFVFILVCIFSFSLFGEGDSTVVENKRSKDDSFFGQFSIVFKRNAFAFYGYDSTSCSNVGIKISTQLKNNFISPRITFGTKIVNIDKYYILSTIDFSRKRLIVGLDYDIIFKRDKEKDENENEDKIYTRDIEYRLFIRKSEFFDFGYFKWAPFFELSTKLNDNFPWEDVGDIENGKFDMGFDLDQYILYLSWLDKIKYTSYFILENDNQFDFEKQIDYDRKYLGIFFGLEVSKILKTSNLTFFINIEKGWNVYKDSGECLYIEDKEYHPIDIEAGVGLSF